MTCTFSGEASIRAVVMSRPSPAGYRSNVRSVTQVERGEKRGGRVVEARAGKVDIRWYENGGKEASVEGLQQGRKEEERRDRKEGRREVGSSGSENKKGGVWCRMNGGVRTVEKKQERRRGEGRRGRKEGRKEVGEQWQWTREQKRWCMAMDEWWYVREQRQRNKGGRFTARER